MNVIESCFFGINSRDSYRFDNTLRIVLLDWTRFLCKLMSSGRLINVQLVKGTTRIDTTRETFFRFKILRKYTTSFWVLNLYHNLSNYIDILLEILFLYLIIMFPRRLNDMDLPYAPPGTEFVRVVSYLKRKVELQSPVTDNNAKDSVDP